MQRQRGAPAEPPEPRRLDGHRDHRSVRQGGTGQVEGRPLDGDADLAAEASFAAAIELREATYRAFAAVAASATPAAADLAVLQRAYAEAMRHARLLPDPGSDQLAWAWEEDDALDRAWWPMARSAVELATAGPLEPVKRCRPGCGFLFLDASKNRIRRWCSMEECGGQTKARRQTARRRAARAQTRAGG